MRDYSTVEIGERVGVSKATLFRWERVGTLPKVARDLQNQRRYKLGEVAEAYYAHVLPRLYTAAADTPDQALAVIEQAAIIRIMFGDLSGLVELEALDGVSAANIQRLVQLAFEQYRPGEATYTALLRVACLQSARSGRAGQVGQSRITIHRCD